MTFLLFTVFLDTLGLSIVMPVMPRLLETMTSQGANTVAREGGFLLCLYALAQFFTSPFLGKVSDRVGRRPILLIALLAYAVDYLCMGFAPNVGWLFVGRFIAGAAGATMVTINAYAADVTPPAERTRAYGYIGAAFGAGFIVGPVLGGFFGMLGVRAPFFGAAALAFLNVLYGWRILPESLPQAQRSVVAPAFTNPFEVFLELRRRPQLRGLFSAYFFQQLSFSIFPSTWTYYCAWRFGWSPMLIGFSLAVSGMLMMLVQGVLVGRAVTRFGERSTIIGATGIAAIVFVGYAVADQTWIIFLLMLCGSAMFFITPALTALLSQTAAADEQGTVQGLLASVLGLTLIVGPIFASQLFATFSGANAPIKFPGAAFLLAGIFMLVAGFVTWFVTQESVSRALQPEKVM